MKISLLCTIVIVSVLYIHIMFHLKTGDDMEVYETTIVSKNKLEDVCNLRQPVLFEYTNEPLQECTLDGLKEYIAFDINVYDDQHIGVSIPLEKSYKLMQKKSYASYHNESFLAETNMKRCFTEADTLLRPPMMSFRQYDILFGSENYETRLKYTNQYRNYFIVTQGSVTLKLTPPRNTKYLEEVKMYDELDFYSSISPWKEVKRVKFLEVTLTQGKLLFIPAYWWYSIRFGKDACVCTLSYKTIMNSLATLPDTFRQMLQRQNTKVKTLPTYITEPPSPPPETSSPSVASHTSAVLAECL